ncbi:BamA/TamA family outer membrane protein [Novosphingobium sp. YJ-S2-02]|uniref:BamA/TamA family outer membrane protein n=1 Tax=Novosphingobium aureum TaxID=2792964 RepID=A0A931HDJ8_9SPHN|nr:BamA/TamA family outer membrane protein [Novosphingobium aureum]MBH0113436.1 BamA/TamA family outer membrane protein [Novosphingobium aureum]
MPLTRFAPPFLLCLALFAAPALHAQERQLEDLEETEDAAQGIAEAGEKPRERIIIPVPIGDPQLGAGLALATALFYQPGKSTRPWTTGVGGFRTSNGSWGGGGVQSMSLARDRLRVQLIAAYTAMNLRYFGAEGDSSDEDEWADVKEKTTIVSAKARLRIDEHIFAGARLRYRSKHSSLRDTSEALEQLVEDAGGASVFDTRQKLVQLGPILTYDDTTEPFAPRSGTIANAEVHFALPALGSDLGYTQSKASWKHYRDMGADDVLAMRAKACLVSKSAPFFDICEVGLRGYPGGRFRDRASWSAEAEWRHRLTRRIGAVGFIGLGSTGGGLGDALGARMLPAIGGGLRYLLAESYGVNLRVDAGFGRDGHAVYVSLGESF